MFLKANGIKHVLTPPYHPASNGLVERYVQTFKDGLKKITGGSIESRVARFLFRYRVTPQSTTGISPAELMSGRKLRTTLDLLKPNVSAKVHQKQTQQKVAHDQHAKHCSFDEGSSVFVYNFLGTLHWLPAVVIKQTGSVTFLVELEDKRQVRRHQDHIRYRASTDNTAIVDNQSLDDNDDFLPILPCVNDPVDAQATVPSRRSHRIRCPPQRFTKGGGL